jgi:hypothetical protein
MLRSAGRLAAACVALLALSLLAPAFAEPAPPADAGRLAMTLAPPLVEGDVDLFDLSPDGTHAIFLTREFGRVQQAYSVRTDGTAAPQLLVAGGNPSPELLAVSNARLLYATYEASSQRALALVVRSVPLDGSAPPTQLDRVDEVGSLGPTTLTPGGQLVYALTTGRGGNVVQQLRSVPADGSGPVALLLSLPGGVAGPFWTIGGAARDHVIYTMSALHTPDSGVFRVPVTGSAAQATRISGDVSGVTGSGLSADGRTVAFQAREALYTVAVEGPGAPRRVTPPLPPQSFPVAYKLSDDGATLVYGVADDSPGASPNTDPLLPVHVYSAPSDGSAAPVRLSPAPVGSFSIFGPLFRVDIAPDNRSVIYYGTELRGGLFIAQVGQADSGRRLSTGLTFPNYRFVGTTQLLVRGDSLELVALDGATPPTVLASPPSRILDTAVAGDRLLYTACSGDCDAGVSLLSVPLAGPEQATVRLATWYRESFVEFRATPAGRVVYTADQDDRPGSELRSVPIAPVGASFAAGALAAAEGATVELELQLGAALSAPAEIGYRVFGAGLDRRGVLTFAPGATAQTLSLALPADAGFTGDRQLLVELRDPVGLAPGFFDGVVVTVRDNEAQRVWLPAVRRPFP